MIEFLKNWVLNIITLAILIVMLEIIMPSGKMKKFINLFSGFILIIAIINPVLGLFKNGINLNDFHISSGNFMARKEIEQKGKLLEEKQMKQITEAYRKKVIKQIEDSTREIDGIIDVKADLIINEDYKSQDFGEIRRVYLVLQTGNKDGSISAVAPIKKVKIKSSEDLNENVREKEVNSGIRKEIENRMNKLGIHQDNIVISLQEE